MSDELAPVRCGCGGEAVVGYTESCLCYVECQKCETETRFFRTEAEAITAWNRAMSGNVQIKGANVPERTAMVWKPAKDRPAYEKGVCSCGFVLSVLQRDFVYCPQCGARLEWV